MARLPISTTLILAVCLVISTGCEQAQPISQDHKPHLDADGQRRSVVLDPPLLSYLKDRRGIVAGGQWYDGRNDVSPAAISGYETARMQRSVTVTRDRQYQVNGHVRDYFTSTTYRSEYRESTR